MTKELNEKKRESESMMKMMEVAELLSGSKLRVHLTEAHRRFVCHGSFPTMCGSKEGPQMELYLFSDLLIIGKQARCDAAG